MTQEPASALGVGSAGHLRQAVSAYLVFAAVLGRRDLPVICPIRRLTGRNCPICGMTRGVASLARLQLRRANLEHPAALALVILTLLSWLNRARSDDRHPGPQARRATGFAPSAAPTAEMRSVASPDYHGHKALSGHVEGMSRCMAVLESDF
jgi:Protein of unknown function (DUF2752)